MAELEPSKLVTRVRFPSPAPPSSQRSLAASGTTPLPPARCAPSAPSAPWWSAAASTEPARGLLGCRRRSQGRQPGPHRHTPGQEPPTRRSAERRCKPAGRPVGAGDVGGAAGPAGRERPRRAAPPGPHRRGDRPRSAAMAEDQAQRRRHRPIPRPPAAVYPPSPGARAAGSWSWADSSSGAGPPRMAAPARPWRSWPRSWV
jgi:hypothetical protein